MRLRLLGPVVLALAGCGNGTPGSAAVPPDALLREGACPFECCTYGTWTAVTSVPLYGAEGDTSRALDTIPAGVELAAETGNVHVERVGVVVVTHPVEPFLEVGQSDPPELGLGDTLYVLDYLGEAYFNVWYRGEVLETSAFWALPGDDGAMDGSDEPAGVLLESPETRWWVRVTTSDGRIGWILMRSEVGVMGADACG